MKSRIAIFASGGGSNAEVIINHFNKSEKGVVVLVVTNNPKAYINERAKTHGIPCYVHSKSDLEDGTLLAVLKESEIDFIVLAGYLQKVPNDLITAFPKHIVNIHPALLPNYGGKGMYGMNVHRAVVENKESQTGITIHYVNENYDEGNIIEQQTCSIDGSMDADEVQQAVLKLEHKYFAPCIERLL